MKKKLLLVVFGIVLGWPAAAQATVTVDPGGTYKTLAAGLARAQATGDPSVAVKPGSTLGSETISANMTKPTTVVGNSAVTGALAFRNAHKLTFTGFQVRGGVLITSVSGGSGPRLAVPRWNGPNERTAP
jgi:hypothetical protein